MPYLISSLGVIIDSTVGTFPAYTTATGSAVATDTVDPRIITVSNWTTNPQDTTAVLDVDGYVWLPNLEVGRITGITQTLVSPGVWKLVIGVDVDSVGTSADFNYIVLKDALQTWRAKVDNQGNAKVIVNDQVPIDAGHSSVWGKARQIRPLKIDASASYAVVSNAVF